MQAKDKLIVALDYPTLDEAKKTVELLEDKVSIYKVGLELFLNSAGEAVNWIHEQGKKVFLDLKFHDIPNTTFMASKFAASKDVFMFNVHAAAGEKAMTEIAKLTEGKEQLAIAVTVLTSMSEEEVRGLYQTEATLNEVVESLADATYKAGMNGIVCSPWEAQTIKDKYGADFKTVCPGVRPEWAAKNDQTRIMTPYKAIKSGCDFIVVGRPITKADSPKNAAELVLGEIEQAIKEL